MDAQRFRARVTESPRGSGVIAIPFDPDKAWGGRAEHPGTGTINGGRVRGRITRSGDGWVFTVSPMWLRDSGVTPGQDALVELAPEGPQRSDLADDIAAALAAGLQAYPVQRVEVGGLVGPDGDSVGPTGSGGTAASLAAAGNVGSAAAKCR